MSEKQEKKALGFDTSGKRIQKWLDEQKELIKDKEVEWAELSKMGGEIYEFANKTADEYVRSEKTATIGMVWLVLSGQAYTYQLIARLGLDITELSDKVSETQKMCKELKLTTKGLSED